MKFLLDVNASGSLAHWIIEYVLEHYNQDLATGAIVIASTRKIRIRRPADSN